VVGKRNANVPSRFNRKRKRSEVQRNVLNEWCSLLRNQARAAAMRKWQEATHARRRRIRGEGKIGEIYNQTRIQVVVAKCKTSSTVPENRAQAIRTGAA